MHVAHTMYHNLNMELNFVPSHTLQHSNTDMSGSDYTDTCRETWITNRVRQNTHSVTLKGRQSFDTFSATFSSFS